MYRFLRASALLCLSLLLAIASARAESAQGRTQYVIISFDGAHELAQWERSRALAARTGASFTYFLSCVFLLSPETRDLYKAPGKKAGRSNVGFAASKEEVSDRLMQIRLAHSEGHEIASHGCGHFDGKAWSKAEWVNEFTAFDTIFRQAYALNGLSPEPADWKTIADGVIGFRAPYLATGKPLYQALADKGFLYDASGVSRGPALADSARGPVRFSLPLIPEGPSSRRVLGMDYNLYVRHSGGFERPGEAKAFEERAYRAFTEAFESEYSGERIPLQLGFHFTLMNGGAYWRALERFLVEACAKPEVACVSYRDYLDRTAPGTQSSVVRAKG